MELDDLKDDPRFYTADKRVENRRTLIPLLQKEFRKKGRDEWLNMLRAVGFPCAPVYSMDEIFEDPQVLHRNMLVEMEHPKAGNIKQIGPVIKFSETPCEINMPPPILGGHTEKVLKSIAGYSEAEIQKLRRTGAI